MEYKNWRLIICADDWDHINFLPLFSTAWRKYFPEIKISIAVYGNRLFSDLWNTYGTYVDTLHKFNMIDGICGANAARMARLYIAGEFGSDICTFNDIDLIPLQRGFFDGVFSRWHAGHLMLFGENYYRNAAGQNKAAMMAMTAESFFLKQLINPQSLSFTDFVSQWKGCGEFTPDNPCDVYNAPYYDDEMIVQRMINRFPRGMVPMINVDRTFDYTYDTVDRACWNLLDKERLSRGDYYFAHCLKPYAQNVKICAKLQDQWGVIEGLAPLMRHVGYTKEID